MKRIMLSAVLMILTISFGAVSLAAEEMKTTGERQITGEEIKELQVVDARLGKGVMDREITEESSEFAVNDRAYLWLKVTGGSADTVTVTWNDGGGGSFSTELIIGTTPWRTWAYKTLYAPGEWQVTVTDSNGKVLKELSFTVR